MAHQKERPRVPAVTTDIVPRPAHGGGTILQEGGEFHLGVEPVIRDYSHQSVAGERPTQEAVDGTAATVPRAAIQENEHRKRPRPGRRIDVELAPLSLAIGHAIGNQPGWGECVQNRNGGAARDGECGGGAKHAPAVQ